MTALAFYWWVLAGYLLYCAWDNTRLFVKPALADPRRKKWPKVSILIPARNEASRIGPCLEGMLTQDYPSVEILVLDDRSTDRTFNVVQGYIKRNPSTSLSRSGRALSRSTPWGHPGQAVLKIFRGKELPTGWLGKPWACFQLARKAKGEYLFFTDADTWHKPDMLKRTVQMAEERKADVLTLFTRQVTKTWMEALVVPVMAFHLLAFLPARWTLSRKSSFSRFAGVSGQFVFIRNRVYRAFGGHQTVKNEIVEDLNFGKRVVQSGYRLVYGDGSDFSFCRMYTNAREVWEGFSKNFFPALKLSPLYFLNAFLALIVDDILPFVVLALGPHHTLFFPALFLCLVLVGIRLLESWLYGFNFASVFLHPLGCAVFALIGINSVRWVWTGQGHWKGRKLGIRPIRS